MVSGRVVVFCMLVFLGIFVIRCLFMYWYWVLLFWCCMVFVY